MRTRDAVIEYQKTLDDAGTLSEDMNVVDPVTALYLEFEARNGTTSNPNNFISDVITKVEIVDGSEVLYSLNLSELEALHFYKLGKTPVLFPSDWPSTGVQRHGCYLLFGRYLGDLEFAMDFTRFRNPQLKITSNLSAIRAAAAAGAFIPATLKATIVAKIMEDAVKPSKYLMAKELLSFSSSSTSGAEERKELNNNLIYRLLMTRHWVEGCDIDEVTSDLKLTADADKFIPFNRKLKQLDAEALAMFGEMSYKHDFKQAYSEHWRIIPNKEPWASLVSRDVGVPLDFVQYAQWSSRLDVEQYTAAGAGDATARRVTAYVHGHAPHATLPIPMGVMDRPDTWFDPTPFKKLELVFTSGGNAGTCAVVAEQVRPL